MRWGAKLRLRECIPSTGRERCLRVSERLVNPAVRLQLKKNIKRIDAIILVGLPALPYCGRMLLS